jgi:epsin
MSSINIVRNRARELVEMLSDVEKIRTERRKAKANRSKYTGIGNDGMSFGSGGERYGGFEGGSYSGNGGGSYDRGKSSPIVCESEFIIDNFER